MFRKEIISLVSEDISSVSVNCSFLVPRIYCHKGAPDKFQPDRVPGFNEYERYLEP